MISHGRTKMFARELRADFFAKYERGVIEIPEWMYGLVTASQIAAVLLAMNARLNSDDRLAKSRVGGALQ